MKANSGPQAGEAFPPFSTSLPAFIHEGTDSAFRTLIYGLLQVSALMLKTREQYGARIGISGPQYSILMTIAERSETTVTELAHVQHVSGTFITAEINKLQKMGLVARRPSTSDRRSSLLSLTEKGKGLVRQISPLRKRANDTVFGSLSVEDAEMLQRAIPALVKGLQAAVLDLEKPE